MQIWCINSAETAWKHSRIRQEDTNLLVLQAARNGHDFGQILLRHTEEFTIDRVEIVDVTGVPANAFTLLLQEYLTFNDGLPYPDRLVPFHPCKIPANTTQSLLLVVAVPAAQLPAKAGCTVRVHTSLGALEAYVSLKIFDAMLPAPKEGRLSHEYFLNLNLKSFLGEAYEMCSEKWWKAMGNIAEIMAKLRINILPVNIVTLLAQNSRRVDEDHWHFDFTTCDRWITLFLCRGSISRIELSAAADSLTGANIASFDEAGNPIKLPVRSSAYEAFAHQLFTAVYHHFAEKGWLPMLITHLEDEPHETENWLWLRRIIAECMPGVPCGEPIDEYDSALGLTDACDIFVPRLNVWEQGADFFARRQAAGKEVWTYSCCYPEDSWYLNRFIDQPARYSRMLKWACFANDITGFLHWGFNYWADGLYGKNADARFKGDGFLVYPDAAHGSVLLSNRALSVLLGAEEYELLALLAQKLPDMAKALAHRVTLRFSQFADDPSLLVQTRAQMLAQCERL